MFYWSYLLRTRASHLMGKAFQQRSCFLELDKIARHLVIVRRCTTQQIESIIKVQKASQAGCLLGLQ